MKSTEDISLLDCTLRDGGYINSWRFGEKVINNIVRNLIEANIEFLEIGFLRNCDYDKNVTCFNSIAEIKNHIPEDLKKSKLVAMALYTDYDIEKLEKCDGTIEFIRITFHDYDYREGLQYCKKVIEKGYKIFINPINIMGFSDVDILNLLIEVNKINPYGFSIVDTFGSMTKKDLRRIYSLCENNLNEDITIGIHLHENLSSGLLLAQYFLEIKSPMRKCSIDGSLYGMGRQPGNLCLELMADYLNRQYVEQYDINPILDAIENYIEPIKIEKNWGYSTEYFLSAKNNVHRNYAEFLQKKGRLSSRGINQILREIYVEKHGTKFEEQYAEMKYREYENMPYEDKFCRDQLENILKDKHIVLVGPGKSSSEILNIRCSNMLVVSANFVPDMFEADFCFFSNIKRFDEYRGKINDNKTIITSNILREEEINCFVIDFSSLADCDGYSDSCSILLLRLMHQLKVREVHMIGFDGLRDGLFDYSSEYFGLFVKGSKEKKEEFDSEFSRLKNTMNIVMI